MTAMLGFEQVGQPAAAGEILINDAQAWMFRNAAFEGSKIQRDDFDPEEGTLLVQTSSYAAAILDEGLGGYDYFDAAFYTKNSSDVNEDYWRSVIHFARFKRREGERAERKIYTSYEVESEAGQVMTAVRKVRVIRDLSRRSLLPNGREREYLHRERKAFERLMLPQDIATVVFDIEHIMELEQRRAA